jgi:hypothetical protein
MNQHEYHAEYGLGKVYKATERLANEWKSNASPRFSKPIRGSSSRATSAVTSEPGSAVGALV